MITKAEFGVIWRYFGWANQTTAMMMLWAAAAFLIKEGKFHWICSIPATFMTAVTFTYLANAKIGFGLDMSVAIVIGLSAATIAIVAFFLKFKNGDAPALTEEDISLD